jgi:hypothetical protein
VRRLAIREGALVQPSLLHDMAEDFFPLPSSELGFWEGVRKVQGNGHSS